MGKSMTTGEAAHAHALGVAPRALDSLVRCSAKLAPPIVCGRRRWGAKDLSLAKKLLLAQGVEVHARRRAWSGR